MFKLMIAITTTLSMMFGATANVESPPGEPLYAEKTWSVQTLSKLRESTQSGNKLEVSVQNQAQTQTHYQINIQEQVETLNQAQNQIDEQIMQQTQDQVRDQVQDQLQDQLQEQDRTHQADTTKPIHLNDGQGAQTGTCETCGSVPQAGLGENGNKP